MLLKLVVRKQLLIYMYHTRAFTRYIYECKCRQRYTCTFIVSALGEDCTDMEECTLSDPNSECDTGFTDTCICTTNYLEVSAVCTSEYIGPSLTNLLITAL